VLHIPGLGEFENGKSYDISDEQARDFRIRNGQQKTVTDLGGVGTGQIVWALGPSLEKVNMYGITVTKDGAEAQEAPAEEQAEEEKGGE
jgi:hypothetical protein